MDEEQAIRRPWGTSADCSPPGPLRADDMSPRRPFTDVLATLRAAEASGRLEPALALLLIAYRPVLDRISYQLVRARGLDPAAWTGEARVVVDQVVLRELQLIVRDHRPVASLTMLLQVPARRAWTDHLAARSVAKPSLADTPAEDASV